MKPESKFKFNKMNELTAAVLILSILFNIISICFMPQKAKAVDVSDFMYLFWDGTCTDAAMPSGWTLVSDGAGEEFYDATNGGLFPRGYSSYARNAGGALTHSHTVTVADAGLDGTSSSLRSGTGNTANATAHTHTGSYTSITSVSSLPSYKNICVIKYNSGIPTGDAAIPNGAVAIFDTDPDGISGWSEATGFGTTYFVRGNSSYGGTDGSNTHQGTGHEVAGVTLNGVAGSVTNNATSGNYICPANHTHTSLTTPTSDTPDTQPQYREIYLGKKSNNGPIPNGMIAMFNDADASVGFSVAGWTRLSDSGGPFYERFLKVTGAYGNTGGNAQHTHAVIRTTSTTYNGTIDTKTGSGAISTHNHYIDTTLTNIGTENNRPPYTNVVIAKKQTAITALSTDAGTYHGIGDIITVSYTINNYHSTDPLNDKKLDFVIFEDLDGDGRPDDGETYVTNNCAGGGVWDDGPPGLYTKQIPVSVAANSSTSDSWNCPNTNFPDHTDYTLWARWWDGTSYAYNIYYDKGSVIFHSIPTLGQILFLGLIGCAVYIGYRQGVIKLKPKKNKEKTK